MMMTKRARRMDWILSAFLAAALALEAWTLSQIYQLHADVAVLKTVMRSYLRGADGRR